jgi:hypothetical protein
LFKKSSSSSFVSLCCLTRSSNNQQLTPAQKPGAERKGFTMPFTEQDLAAQASQLEQLKAELFRLDGIYEKQLKTLGFSEDELRKLDPEKFPVEVKKLMEEAKQTAKRTGESRAASAKSQLSTNSSGSNTSYGSNRRRAIRP